MKTLTYSAVVEELKKHKNPVHLTKKELQIILDGQETGNFEETHKTRLYIKYGGEYCSLLEVLNYMKGES